MVDHSLPKLSLVVHIERLAHAEDTLFSLSAGFQQKVAEKDYEIIVVESPSPDRLGERRAMSVGSNLRYVSASSGESPFRLGVAHARATCIGLLFDGSALLTPRVVEQGIVAQRLAIHSLAIVPSYDIVGPGAGAANEGGNTDAVLDKLDWKHNGYNLFTAGAFGEDVSDGYLCPLAGASCLFLHREFLDSAKLKTTDLLGALTERHELAPVILLGEGVFHRIRRPKRPENRVHLRQPLLLGAIPGPARRFLRQATERSIRRDTEGRIDDTQGLPEQRAVELEASAPGPRCEVSSPRISIVVVFYKIPRQAENTLYSLSQRHQRKVNAEDYEIVVVENSSDKVLGPERAQSYGANVRYFYREESGVSPVGAVNFAFEQARAPLVGLMIDGAHMVTPGVVEHALLATGLHDNPVISVPAYHLGKVEHHLNRTAGYGEEVEQRLLDSVQWRADGYALFDIACWSGANYGGFLCPPMESNCIFCTRQAFVEIGRADVRFDSPGGGLLNQDIFARLCRLQSSRFIVPPGEGSFHQFHGGVSTSELDNREELMESLRLQYEAIHGHRVIGHDREPFMLGRIPAQARPFLRRSAELGVVRYRLCLQEGRAEWPND